MADHIDSAASAPLEDQESIPKLEETMKVLSEAHSTEIHWQAHKD